MIWLLLTSSVTVLRSCVPPRFQRRLVIKADATHTAKTTSGFTHNIPELAIPQLVLAVAAITNFHVQIINRIASGYPTWYTMVAIWMVEELDAEKSHNRSQWVIRVMITYTLTQGMLFANFLPPA